MIKHLIPAIACASAIAAFSLAPAHAADDITSKTPLCEACHGQNGQPVNSATPIIWGQKANYLYKELHDFHSGERASPIMAPLIHSYTLAELRQVADFFAAKSWPVGAVKAASESPPQESAMCQACHGKTFEGGAPAPRLAGLSYDYLVTQMNAFADGQRANNLDMPGFMRALSEGQRQSIAHYLAKL